METTTETSPPADGSPIPMLGWRIAAVPMSLMTGLYAGFITPQHGLVMVLLVGSLFVAGTLVLRKQEAPNGYVHRFWTFALISLVIHAEAVYPGFSAMPLVLWWGPPILFIIGLALLLGLKATSASTCAEALANLSEAQAGKPGASKGVLTRRTLWGHALHDGEMLVLLLAPALSLLALGARPDEGTFLISLLLLCVHFCGLFPTMLLENLTSANPEAASPTPPGAQGALEERPGPAKAEGRNANERRGRRLGNLLAGLLCLGLILLAGFVLSFTPDPLQPQWVNYLVVAPFVLLLWTMLRDRFDLHERPILHELMWTSLSPKERREARIILAPCLLAQGASMALLAFVLDGILPGWVALFASAVFLLAQLVTRAYGWRLRRRHGRPLFATKTRGTAQPISQGPAPP